MSINYTREYIDDDTKTKSKKKDLKNDNDVVDKAEPRDEIRKSLFTRRKCIGGRIRGSLFGKKVNFSVREPPKKKLAKKNHGFIFKEISK